MKQIFYKKIFLISIVFLFLCVVTPLHAFAARVYLETDPNTLHVGNTFVISVKVDSENETINVVKGQIDLGPDISLFKVGGMSIAESVLSLWPEEPSLSADGRTISFEGGVPKGFNVTDATLFSITASAEKRGQTSIAPDKLEAYLNDGKGTLTSTTGTALDITIHEATSVVSLKNIIILVLAVILLICIILFTKRRLKK